MIGFFLYNRIALFFVCIFMIFFIHYVSSNMFRLNNIVLRLNTLDKLNMMKSVDGQMLIYRLLRKFVKRSGINWFDLRDNYSLLKKYIRHKL